MAPMTSGYGHLWSSALVNGLGDAPDAGLRLEAPSGEAPEHVSQLRVTGYSATE
jgi:hypothetical protein